MAKCKALTGLAVKGLIIYLYMYVFIHRSYDSAANLSFYTDITPFPDLLINFAY